MRVVRGACIVHMNARAGFGVPGRGGYCLNSARGGRWLGSHLSAKGGVGGGVGGIHVIQGAGLRLECLREKTANPNASPSGPLGIGLTPLYPYCTPRARAADRAPTDPCAFRAGRVVPLYYSPLPHM